MVNMAYNAFLQVHGATSQEPILIAEILSERTLQFLFRVYLTKLTSAEVDLNRGRFSLYSATKQSNKVYVRMDKMTGGELQNSYGIILEWIAQNSRDLWSAAVVMHSVNEAVMEFSFLHATDAVIFSLVFT